MRWTPEDVAKLNELAGTGIGGRLVAEGLKRPWHAVRAKASEINVSLRRRRETEDKDNAVLRKRWAAKIGPMREQLREELRMSEMVERVAEALCQQALGGPLDRLSLSSRDGYRGMARAAIEAMREPTDWMIDRMTPELMIAENAWRAGIDAALGETR